MSDWPTLVPELCCTDIARSVALYREAFGFEIAYEREGFAMLGLGGARLMLEQLTEDSWLAGPAEPPFGRGMNLEIEVPELDALLARANAAGLTPFRPPETVWYRTGDVCSGQRQVIFADPDGYLLRFVEVVGERAEPPAGERRER